MKDFEIAIFPLKFCTRPEDVHGQLALVTRMLQVLILDKLTNTKGRSELALKMLALTTRLVDDIPDLLQLLIFVVVHDVELTGVEPVTSAMPLQRYPS